MVKEKVYVIDENDYLQFGPAYTPTVTVTQSPTASLNATMVLAPVIAAMSQVTSVNIDSNIVDQYTIRQPSETTQYVHVWDGQRSVDINNNQMHLTMNIDDFGEGFFTGTKTNLYYDKENSYGQSWMSGGLSPQGRWYQSKLGEGILSAENQLSPIIELLESANQTIFRTTGKLDGPNYQVIEFSPSAEAVADWLLSLEFQGSGPSLRISTGIAIIGKNTFMKTFKGGTFYLWVDSESNLIMKAYFAPVFQATLDELNEVYGFRQSGRTEYHESDFIAQLDFSGYNQPVNIQIPSDALNAK